MRTRELVDGNLRCPDCGEWKPVEDFASDRRRSHGAGTYCLECWRGRALKATKAYHARHPERRKATTHRQNLARIGWTPEAKAAAIEVQGGLCANPACDNPATDADHDHATGLRRQVLCHGCNKALGFLGEDPQRIAGLMELVLSWQ